MQMTEAEIKRAYREAKFPAQQVQILADLNGCEPSEIRAIIGNDVEEKPRKRKTKVIEENSENIAEKMPEEVALLLECRIRELRLCARNERIEAEKFDKRADTLQKYLDKNRS